MVTSATRSLLGLDYQELTDLALEASEPAYRGRQMFDAIYRQRIETLDRISTLPAAYRGQLAELGWQVGMPQIGRKFESSDGTIRYLMELADGESVETVWMPDGDGGEAGDGSESEEKEDSSKVASPNWRRATICVSSQVGCAVNCQFCLTALLGVKRNLTAGEIVGQIAVVLRDQDVQPPLQRVNLVFMGMGEPFLNYDNFMKSVRLLVEGVGIPESRMTVSTAGIVPRIRDLSKEAIRPKLAISLNASNDKLRSEIMPLNRKWDISQILAAARDFTLRPRERLTLEYVLLAEVNDSPEDARHLAELVRGLRAKINLIALNPGTELPYRTPAAERVLEFQRIVVSSGVPAFIRKPRGRDIYAACGQLKRTVELTSIEVTT